MKTTSFSPRYKTIIIDGDFKDWDNRDRIYLDTDGPDCDNVDGQDIKTVYMAQDDTFVYFRFVLNGTLDESFGYKIGDVLHTFVGQENGIGYIFYAWPSWFDIKDLGYDLSEVQLPDSYVAVKDNQFEAKFLKRDVRIWKNLQLKAWCDQGFETVCRDYIELKPITLDLP